MISREGGNPVMRLKISIIYKTGELKYFNTKNKIQKNKTVLI